MAGNNTIGTAYVQIVPSADGIKGSITNLLGGESQEAGKKSGESMGSSLVSSLKNIIVAAGVGTLIKDTLQAGADYEQLVGGVDKLFGEASEKVKAYADEAYKTAGMSKNAYMEQVTSFSASLISSMAGDVNGAADVANMALQDMADNANTFGSDMESLQNAYNGFAKQNYTMLDNLKLGYGGTKSEMERLLKDAEKLTGVKYDINSLDDVYTAIHVIQQETNIAGTTSKEAAQTFSGSFEMMKASAENLMTAIASGEGVSEALQETLDSVGTFVFGNAIPMLGQMAMSLAEVLPDVLMETIPQLIVATEDFLWTLLDSLEDGIPIVGDISGDAGAEFINCILDCAIGVWSAGVELIKKLATGLIDNLPSIIKAAGTIMGELLDDILWYGPIILSDGISLIGDLAKGLLKNMPAIVSAIASVMASLLAKIGENLPTILQKGIELITKLIAGIIQAIPKIPGAIKQVISSAAKEFSGYDWKKIGSEIINGVKNGITGGIQKIKDAAKSAAKSAFESAKSFLGIKSPSRLFKNEIGKNVALGMAEGISGNIGAVEDAMDALSETSVGRINTELNVAASSDTKDATNKMIKKLDELSKVMKEGSVIKVEGREFGRAVRAYG